MARRAASISATDGGRLCTDGGRDLATLLVAEGAADTRRDPGSFGGEGFCVELAETRRVGGTLDPADSVEADGFRGDDVRFTSGVLVTLGVAGVDEAADVAGGLVDDGRDWYQPDSFGFVDDAPTAFPGSGPDWVERIHHTLAYT